MHQVTTWSRVPGPTSKNADEVACKRCGLGCCRTDSCSVWQNQRQSIPFQLPHKTRLRPTGGSCPHREPLHHALLNHFQSSTGRIWQKLDDDAYG
eukprot:1576597-Rhodomonas_salina.1